MGQPVKLSNALVLDARLAGEVQERSIAGQVEYWAKLGQSVDALLKGPQVLALRRAAQTETLSRRLASVDSPAGRARVEAYLQTRPYPHYKEAGQPGLLVRVDEDGTKTTGRFVNRIFVPVVDKLPRFRQADTSEAAVVVLSKAKDRNRQISAVAKARRSRRGADSAKSATKA